MHLPYVAERFVYARNNGVTTRHCRSPCRVSGVLGPALIRYICQQLPFRT